MIPTQPVTTKQSEDGVCDNLHLRYGASSMQGWRGEMEDAHITEPNFDDNVALFAIFDGHGGPEVAIFCEKHFGKELKANKAYKNKDYVVALAETFFKMDQLLFSKDGKEELKRYMVNKDVASFAGCTCNVVLISDNIVYCANAGDSRSIITNGKQVLPLNSDHKPSLPVEKERINKAGGCIFGGRVNGTINLSRAIGDLDFKKNLKLKPTEQLISAEPDITSKKLNKEDKFILMGCDGVWEILNAKQLCEIVIKRLEEDHDRQLSKVVEELLDKGIAKDNSNGLGMDNMSSILIVLNH